MHSPTFFQELIEAEIKKIPFAGDPAELYDPIRYMLSLGGKRLRPALLLMANELFGGKTDQAISPALGVEIFHNFTLLHDDIMDKAPIRRARPTVHTRWNTDIAILSGDAMFVKACQFMLQSESRHQQRVMELFLRTALEVCEGQQLDMNFETRAEVSISEYIGMITRKTAVLLGAALEIGAILGDAKESEAQQMYMFGKDLGIAFQLHDDILDVYGDEQKFGKQVGGDILANKKTFLLLTALQRAGATEKREMKHRMSLLDFDPSEKVQFFKTLYGDLRVREYAEAEMEKYFMSATSSLQAIGRDTLRKEPLLRLAEQLMVREN